MGNLLVRPSRRRTVKPLAAHFAQKRPIVGVHIQVHQIRRPLPEPSSARFALMRPLAGVNQQMLRVGLLAFERSPARVAFVRPFVGVRQPHVPGDGVSAVEPAIAQLAGERLHAAVTQLMDVAARRVGEPTAALGIVASVRTLAGVRASVDDHVAVLGHPFAADVAAIVLRLFDDALSGRSAELFR